MERDKKLFCKSLSDYFKQGEKKSKGYGIELEYFLLTNDNKFVDYYGTFTNGEISVQKVFDLLISNGLKPKYSLDYENCVVGLTGEGFDISLEAGSQFEISFDVQYSIADFVKTYRKTMDWLSNKLATLNVRFEKCGYNPADLSEKIEIYPNNRYKLIYQHLKQFSKNAACGLKSTASCQVSIDYCDEKDCGNKLKAALFLSPIIYFIFDNSKIFEKEKINIENNDGRSCEDKYYPPLRMPRMLSYKLNDPDRVEMSTQVIDSEFSYQKYAEQFFDKSIIFARDSFKHFSCSDFKVINGLYYSGNTKVKDIIKFNDTNDSLTQEEIVHLLAISWFDVRLRQTIELRCADSSDEKYMFAYLALIEGLFYSNASIEKMNKLLEALTYADYVSAKDELYFKGKDAYVYGKPIFVIAKEIIDIANNALIKSSPNDAKLLAPLLDIVKSGKCVVDMQDKF